jgi:hypothetical protein
VDEKVMITKVMPDADYRALLFEMGEICRIIEHVLTGSDLFQRSDDPRIALIEKIKRAHRIPVGLSTSRERFSLDSE